MVYPYRVSIGTLNMYQYCRKYYHSYKRAESNILTCHKGPHHWNLVVVWVIHLSFTFIYDFKDFDWHIKLIVNTLHSIFFFAHIIFWGGGGGNVNLIGAIKEKLFSKMLWSYIIICLFAHNIKHLCYCCT